jgi:hypothetical protein
VNLVFVESDRFSRKSPKIISDEDFQILQNELEKNPEAGAMIPGTGGARKIRIAAKGHGKSGGARVIYFIRISKSLVYFLDIYAKNEKSNMSPEDKKEILKFTGSVKG